MDSLELSDIAREISRLSLSMIAGANMGHPGGSLSQADLLAVLYFRLMNVRPRQPDWPDRDRLVFSKGHACASLYAALAVRGYFPLSDLETFGELGSHLQSHPDRKRTPGVEVSSGSLGQGLSQAVGMALAAKMKNRGYTVYALLGDGECDSGQVWEAAMSAAHYGLGNLIAIVDHNKLQAKGTCADIMNLEPLADKWTAFNWRVFEVDGHDYAAMEETIIEAGSQGREAGKPCVVIAHTIKGKGVSFMENVTKWHNAPPTEGDLAAALVELGSERDD